MSSRRRKQTEMDCCGTGGSEKAEEGHYGIGRAKSAAYDARKKKARRGRMAVDQEMVAKRDRRLDVETGLFT